MEKWSETPPSYFTEKIHNFGTQKKCLKALDRPRGKYTRRMVYLPLPVLQKMTKLRVFLHFSAFLAGEKTNKQKTLVGWGSGHTKHQLCFLPYKCNCWA